jgi:hypothetical protein
LLVPSAAAQLKAQFAQADPMTTTRLAQTGRSIVASAMEGKVADQPDSSTEAAPDWATASESTWIQMYDEQVESNYYYNKDTGEASWIRPDDFLDDDDDGSLSMATSRDVWEQYWDESVSAFYMHNPATGETRWAEGAGGIQAAQPKR